MLKQLSIRNIVLISACDIPFEDGLCVLTGETGAGKSILLDALGLALGERGDSGLLRDGEEQASVTAEFHLVPKSTTHGVLSDLGLEADDVLVIRRIIGADGKSRCFVNDQPVSVTGLKRIGETLVEVHGQHDQRGLLDMRTHLDLLDAYGRLEAQRAEVSMLYERWAEKRDALRRLRESIVESQREQDYLQHMCGELRTLAVEEGEEARLADQRATMMQSEKLADTIQDCLRELQHDVAVDAALRTAQRILTRSSQAMSVPFQQAVDALERAQLEVQEAVGHLEQIAQDSAYDPHKLESMEERLFAIKAAARKYNIAADDIPKLLHEVEDKLSTIDNQQQRIGEMESDMKTARDVYLSAAQSLSDARGAAAQRLQRALIKELGPLKMGRCRFRVVQEELGEDQWNARGTDAVRFEAATNVGQNYAPLHKIASGGELSRFMLALKVVLASLKSTPTLIFDEIDTGTGGAVADAIGARLALLSDSAQVLVVTHLPQVAARGTHHLYIEKSDSKKATNTTVTVLDVAARKEELARMLAGAEVTDEARGAASKLMEAAG